MTRRSIVAVISICVHAIVLLVVMTADLWRPISEWPTPRSALAFVQDNARRVVIDDRPPIPRATGTPHPSSIARADLAPVTPPDSIGTEIVQSPGLVVEPERNDGGTADFGLLHLPPPTSPPPPPASSPAPAPIRLHSGIRAPQRIVNVTPAYPAIARSARVEGVVIIETTIDENGNVVRAQILRSIPLLDAAALDAVRQWKFSPTLLNGVPVPIVMTVTVNFRLN